MDVLGRLLDIDLTQETYTFRPYPLRTVSHCLAGRGFNVGYLYTHLGTSIDPLGPQNTLVFSCGLLTGLSAPATSRLHVNALSPLTGLLGSSNVGGDFGLWLRTAGIQTMIVRGKGRRPMWLLIENDRVVFTHADHLWGLDTWVTQERLETSLGHKTTRSLVIGPAGEKGVLYACMMTGRDHAAGRTGMGAVMGAKLLKAIAVRTDRPSASGLSRKPHAAVTAYAKKITASPDYDTFRTYGGCGYVKWANDMGIMAAYNYRRNRLEDSACPDGRHLKRYQIRSKGCFRCPVRCKADLDLMDSNANGTAMSRPEFESMINLGPKCGLNDIKAIVCIDNLCSRLGLDSISTGSAIAYAMDLNERGWLHRWHGAGRDLSWGNAEAMATLVKQIADREGLGAVLAQGVRRAAALIGRGAERYAPHVKGLELTAYHPDAIPGTALGYMMAGRGGDYSSVYPAMEYRWTPNQAAAQFGTPKAVDFKSTDGKAPLVKRAMIVNAVLDCLGICKVPALSMIGTFDLRDEAALTTAVSGLKVSAAQLFEVGKRIIDMERWFNLLRGATAADDGLPAMFFCQEYAAGQQPHVGGPKLTGMRSAFYREMGWNRRGVPKAPEASINEWFTEEKQS